MYERDRQNWNFVILDHPRSRLCCWFCCENLVSIRYLPSEILRLYDFASLAGKCLTTPPFWGFWSFEPQRVRKTVVFAAKYQLNSKWRTDAILGNVGNANSPTSGPIWTKLGWSHPINSPTCPPWCGCHGKSRCLATVHWTFNSDVRLEAIRVIQFWWNLV